MSQGSDKIFRDCELDIGSRAPEHGTDKLCAALFGNRLLGCLRFWRKFLGTAELILDHEHWSKAVNEFCA